MAAKFFGGARTLLRLFVVYSRLDLLWFLRDTKYCLLYLLADVVCAGASVTGVYLLSARFGGFGGMSENDVLFMLSYAVLVDGLYSLFCTSNNMGNISRVIGRGQLDHCMVQPVPIWMQLLASGFAPISGSSKLVCGVALTAVSVSRLGEPFTAGQVFGLAAGAVCSTAVIAAFVNAVSCLAFVSPAGAEEIAQVAHAPFDMLKTYPLGGLSPLWQTFFCTVIPVGVTAWLPSNMLLGGRFPFVTLLIAAVFVTAMFLIFRKGMIYYATQGSPRYSGFGHR